VVDETVRVIYRPTITLRVAIAATLAMWSILFAYLVGYTSPPFVVILLLFLPVLLLAWVLYMTNTGVSWEIDSIAFRKLIGDRLVDEIPLRDVASVMSFGNPAEQAAILRIFDRAGKERTKLVTGPAVGFEDVRVIYETLASRTTDFGSEVANPFGWKAASHTATEYRTKGERVSLLPHFATSLIATGLLTLATGTYAGRILPVQYGIGIAILGAAAFGASHLIRRRHQKRPSRAPVETTATVDGGDIDNERT